MRKSIFSAFLFLLSFGLTAQESVEFNAKDGIKITGDYYAHESSQAPLILLFHQAGYSRGEYKPIAAHLNDLGFSCLAIDQRSGNKVNGVENQTKKEAKKMGKPTSYVDAFVDLEAALNYANTELNREQVIVWGSSYSSSLVFILANKYPNKVKALLAFSPGEYFSFEEKKVEDFAKGVKCPVFVTSSKGEFNSWEGIYANVKGEKSSFIPEQKGFHGSKALWVEKEGNKYYWEAVTKFLNQLKK